MFKGADPGVSLYEGRTRGQKRIRYTYSDDEDDWSDATSTRRNSRNAATHTPFERPTVTASGRTIRPRHGGLYGARIANGKHAQSAHGSTHSGSESGGRPRRAAAAVASSNGLSEAREAMLYNFGSDLSEPDDDDDKDTDHVETDNEDYGDEVELTPDMEEDELEHPDRERVDDKDPGGPPSIELSDAEHGPGGRQRAQTPRADEPYRRDGTPGSMLEATR
jgi:hypothetical protein